MKRINVSKPVVEISGDEMANVIWDRIKELLILPFLNIDIINFDLSVQNRDATDDKITIDAAHEIKKVGVGIKCATITPDDKRVAEFQLKRKYPSPNGTIRNILQGTIFREPLICKNIPKIVPHWNKPVIIARHAFGDIYKARDLRVKKGSIVNIEVIDITGKKEKKEVHKFNSDGIALGMLNEDQSIKNFARSCFLYALDKEISLFLSTKNTILQNYDERFKEIFEKEFNDNFKNKFQEKGIFYQHKLIDDMVACLMKWNGGYIWACKNYDGDVISDLVAQGYGSLGLMTSILKTPDGKIVETEAAHGTVTSHFRQHQLGKETSTNPIASIFAWTQGLWHRGKMDKNTNLMDFCKNLEKSCIMTVENGYMTKDLALMVGPNQKWLTTNQLLNKIKDEIKAY
ncbi:MAG: isocitrate dehydrogenase (NADP(+)) [Rickettsiales bacterium]|nr:isocitrate dehydrogenase (NADP(+)) [Rickettsiales bacterium]